MLQHAQSELPNECCGILAGVPDGDALRVIAWYPLVNEAASPVEYRSDARSMFEATKQMRHHGQEIVAVYHSHPTSEPIPSRTDLERRYSDDVIHLIMGLAGPQPVLRGWWLTATDYDEATLRIVDG
jgi:[CysO sulfur-carrier protein]-S-L-cysteine hydrolase